MLYLPGLALSPGLQTFPESAGELSSPVTFCSPLSPVPVAYLPLFQVCTVLGAPLGLPPGSASLLNPPGVAAVVLELSLQLLVLVPVPVCCTLAALISFSSRHPS